jgi:KDO2-lipid IV(A) lauroyltransferase
VAQEPTDFRARDFLSPRYWPTWLGLGVLRLVVRLPYALQMRLGALFGWTLYHTARWRRAVARINIELCFPQLPEVQREAMVRHCFLHAGMSLPETALCWWGTARQLERLGRVEGLHHLQAALARGRGVILLSAHMTCLEIAGRLLALRQPFHVMYKRHRNPLFEAIMRGARERQFERAVPHHDVRGMLQSLKENKAVWYAPDQDFGRKQSVFAPFMGVDAATLTAPARLAKISGAAVVPFFPERVDNGRGYRLVIHPALEVFPSDDDVRDATRINTIVGQHVRRVPEQYLWLHRRFKTRPEGETSPYPKNTRRRRRKKHK